MNGWLIDCYRNDNKIILWIKTADGRDLRLAMPFEAFIYASIEAIPDLRRHGVPFKMVTRKTYMHQKTVLEIKVPNLDGFEGFVRHIEGITRHRVTLYNGDIKPEQMFLYRHDLCPFTRITLEKDRIMTLDESLPSLRRLILDVNPNISTRYEWRIPVRSISFNGQTFKGPEEQVLKEFAHGFNAFDPDLIFAQRAYAVVPYLMSRMANFKIHVPFDRWDGYLRRYRGGRSYWSYNQVRFQDFSVKLKGRLLIDQSTFVGSECDADAIIEMVKLSGTLFQQTVARSFGAVFQSALVRLMVREGMIVPFKDKPLEPPLSMLSMLKADRGGLTIDPKLGFHTRVAELDFVSMFPWLIYNHNISADSILSAEGPFEEIPNLPVTASLKSQALIPRALKPFIDRRMYYKYHPSEANDRRSRGLKWVLVSCYGYLRYREFKLGIPTSHMAICAFAREVLLKCVHLAEERGFEVIHGIVDSLYVTKPGMTMEDLEALRLDLESMARIPLMCEGIFKWVVFSASRVDPHRALPATYFGVFEHGGIKARGIEVRQRAAAAVIKFVQESVLNSLRDCSSPAEIAGKIPGACIWARTILERLEELKPSLLTVHLKVSQSTYKHNIPQKAILEALFRRGIKVEPGQSISFIYSDKGPVLVEDYARNPKKEIYTKLAVRALAVLFEPFGVSRKEIHDMVMGQGQYELDFTPMQEVRYNTSHVRTFWAGQKEGLSQAAL